jgi:hypothetical protein
MASETLQEAWSKLSGQVDKFSQKVAPLFLHNGWQWTTWTSGMQVPTQEMIAGTLHSLVWEAFQSVEKSGADFGAASTGRLQARFTHYKRGWVGVIEVIPEWIES